MPAEEACAGESKEEVRGDMGGWPVDDCDRCDLRFNLELAPEWADEMEEAIEACRR
jgi:hypothetical protein